ncbi:GNAT family N-acetyltransferase [Streptomyces tateyamensis]|uniref:GNAT family N-acetyltransferase n=1 Tax=Streptomyces tateyamensis TaxID=565073 RepID=UPI001FE72491|nr:GNAT family N-acetyltransferase [Streptomyces tateyamensis]
MDEPILNPAVLETDRLLLRPPGPADVAPIFEICQDPEIQRWTVVPSPYRQADAEFFVHTLAADGWRTGRYPSWCVIEKATGALVGTQSLAHRGPGSAEVGYWAAPAARGKGFTIEALRAVCRWGVAERGLRRLEWTAYVGNEPSRALARRAGFTMEGTLRSYAAQRGQWRDVWMGSLLAEEVAPA